MGFWADSWEMIVALHQSGDLTILVPFYGVVVAVIVFVCLQLMLIKGRRLAVKAAQAARDLIADLKALHAQVNELEQRLENRLDARTGDLDVRMTRKIDQKGDILQERLDQHRSALSDSVGKLEARLARTGEQLEAYRERTDEVESRIPGLFDRLDDFRDTLAQTFQAELGGVFTSFDNSVAAILQQMKAELELGVSRIESIEGMVRSRDRAQLSLLGPRGEAALPGPAPEQGEEAEFEEWEQQAKELAEQDEGHLQAAEAEPPPAPAPAEAQDAEYPAEMNAADADEEDEVDSDLLASLTAPAEDEAPEEMGEDEEEE